MSTVNYLKICESQQREPSVRLSQYEETNAPRFYGKKRAADVVAAELRTQRRDYRSNMCSTCFAARSSNGSCNCE